MTQKKFCIMVFSISIFTILYTTHVWAYDEKTFQVQACLQDKGYQPGSPDGLYGKKTMGAIKQFQNDNGLPITGKLSEELIRQVCEGVNTVKYRKKTNYKEELSIPLIVNAAKNNNYNLVKERLLNGDDVNTKWVNVTALMYAAHNGNYELVKLLVQNGAEINLRSTSESAIYLADYGNYLGKQSDAHATIVAYLVKNVLQGIEKPPSSSDIRELVISMLRHPQGWLGNGGVQLFQIFPNDPGRGEIRVRCNAATWGKGTFLEVAKAINSGMPEPNTNKIYNHYPPRAEIDFKIKRGSNGKWSIVAIKR